MAEIKITKKMKYERIMAILNGEPIIAEDKEMLTEFCEHEIELLNKKKDRSSNEPSEKQIENERLAEVMYDLIASADGAPVSFQEMRDSCEEFKGMSPQKMTALIKILGQRVVKVMDKKTTCFVINTEYVGE